MRLAILALLPLLVVAHGDRPLDARHKAYVRAISDSLFGGAASAPSPPAATTSPAGASPTGAPALPSSPAPPGPSSAPNVPSSPAASSRPPSSVHSGPSISTTSVSSIPLALLTSSVSSTFITTFTFQLAATNPTAVPLSVINSLQPSSVTTALPSTAVPGSTPTFLKGAPPLPLITGLSANDYPPPDRPAPTDSPEVQQWIQEVKDTGVVIPGFSVTNATGGCANNTIALSDPNRCWWTCGGCTRSSDIVECPSAMTWGLTYDDGPAFYTPNLLEFLDQEKLKATFFVVGSRVFYNWAMLQSQYMGQHQIAVHTWSHFPLTSLTNEQIIAELGWSKKIIKDVLGVTPNMMRPPYGDIDDRVRAISLAMGLTPVMWTRVSPLATFDTDDFNIQNGQTSVQQVLQNWENILGNATTMNNGFIVLEHDLFEQTVEVATGYILPDALAHKPSFKIQPVIQCLNKDLNDAYIETNANNANPPPISAAISNGLVTITGSAAAAIHTGKSAGFSVHSNTGSLLSLAGLGLGALQYLNLL